MKGRAARPTPQRRQPRALAHPGFRWEAAEGQRPRIKRGLRWEQAPKGKKKGKNKKGKKKTATPRRIVLGASPAVPATPAPMITTS